MSNMGLNRGGINQGVIDVRNHEPAQEDLQHVIDKALEYWGSARELIRHDAVLIMARYGAKVHFPLVTLPDMYKIISTVQVQFQEYLDRLELFQS